MPGASGRSAATAAKMNVYMRPDQEGIDSHPARLIASVVEDCAREDVLVVIEILTYALEGESSGDYKARRLSWSSRPRRSPGPVAPR